MTTYKVLSMYPEHAEMFRLGLRTIETKSKPTRYRGPLAIHATLRDPDSAAARRDPISRRSMAAIPHGNGLVSGAIVATAQLVDVVPIHEDLCCDHDGLYVLRAVGGLGREILGLFRPDGLAICYVNANAHEHPYVAAHGYRDMTADLPYGDYRCGRYAWLLADVEALAEPVPFKGGQGLTKEWTPDYPVARSDTGVVG